LQFRKPAIYNQADFVGNFVSYLLLPKKKRKRKREKVTLLLVL